MILKAIFCVQHFCSFSAMLFNLNLLIKTDSTVICVSCMLKGELQRENKLISYKRAFKMLKNDKYIAGIDQAVLELLKALKLSQGITKGESPYFTNFRTSSVI